MNRRSLLFTAALALLPLTGARADVTTGFLDKTVKADGDSLQYVVYVPRNYSADKKWPVVLFLHGSGERGSDGEKQSQVGIGSAIRMNPDRYPAIVVMPQCPSGQSWRGKPLELALKAVDQTMGEYSIDADRQYLTGLSMGGFGSWLLGSMHPDRFAAMVPVCGGGKPEDIAPKLAKMPIWVWHGDADPAVPIAQSRNMVAALKEAGNTGVKFTELPGVGHNSWDAAYGNAELAKWLFEQKRH